MTEFVEKDGAEYAIVHIYAEAPDYRWVHDDDEGAACVDDAARAAVVYLRDYELNGTAASKRKAEALIRFVLYMQASNGLFYNFVWNDDLDINTEHQNSRADELSWWTARAVWALGRCGEILGGEDLGRQCHAAVERVYPHIEERLAAYGETFDRNGRTYPEWLLHETASDATSELLLGLAAMPRTPRLEGMIDRLVEGIGMMQYGRVGEFPYGAHASWTEIWHAWGNAQTMALSALARRPMTDDPPSATDDRLSTAVHESTHFFPTLLVDGWQHSIDFADSSQSRQFEQIAYGVRGVALGLLSLYEVTGDEEYAVMAGLAASWFTGNNVARTPMYDPATGRGYDGITDARTVNRNAGAESTIEALMTLLEIEHVPAARRWLRARGDQPVELTRAGTTYRYRIFHGPDGDIAVVLNLTDHTATVMEPDAMTDLLND